MTKGIKLLKGPMYPVGQGECSYSNDLFAADIPVWFENSGKVNPEWLSICRKERTQTTRLLEPITSFGNREKSYKQVKSNGGSAGVDGMSVKDFGVLFAKNWQDLQRELQEETYRPEPVRGI